VCGVLPAIIASEFYTSHVWDVSKPAKLLKDQLLRRNWRVPVQSCTFLEAAEKESECCHATTWIQFSPIYRKNQPSESRQYPLFRFIRLHPSFIHLSQKYFNFELQNKNSRKKHKLQINKIIKQHLHNFSCINVTSIAARGGGGSFKREKIYNAEEHVAIESFVTTLIH